VPQLSLNWLYKWRHVYDLTRTQIDILGGMTMSAVEANVQSAQYVDFWNNILVPKFIKYKHILVDGLTHHSEAIFPSLSVKEGR
jgi:hypothetical protein